MVRTLADENIPFVKEAFGHFGPVETLAGRAITPASVKDIDILVVRSVTRVDGKLLAGSRVRFVGTATIGMDHLDLEYFKWKKIAVASAPGSNAVSVAEYIVTALLILGARKKFALRGLSMGIIGAGEVGRRVAVRARALGLKVVLNDPPLYEKTSLSKYRPLKEALACDIVTLHVPLIRERTHPTFQMAGHAFFKGLKKGALLLNTSRGDVVDPAALWDALAEGRLGGLVLDVWPGEPDVDVGLLKKADLGTPHIAGYSYDGKVRGTEMIYRAAARFLKIKPRWTVRLPPPPVPRLSLPKGLRGEAALLCAATTVYDLAGDDRRMRKLLKIPAGERSAYFDRLRKEYPIRREFANTRGFRLPPVFPG